MTDTLYGVVTRKPASADVRIERNYNYPAAELWSALTDKRRMAGWLGDISGDLRVGGTYRAELGQAVGTSNGRILACEPEQRLLVSWQFVGAHETELEAWLDDTGSGTTKLTLENRGIALEDAPAGYSAGWHVFCDRLGELLDSGSATSFIDVYHAAYSVYDDQLNSYGVIAPPEVDPDGDASDRQDGDNPDGDARGDLRFDRVFAFPPDDVWSAITEPDRLARWLGTVTGDLRADGHFALDFGDGDTAGGHILTCEKPARLAVTWEFPGEGTTHLDAELSPAEGGTRLMLTHTGLRRRDLVQYGAGWHTFLDHLGVMLGGGDPSGWDARYAELHPRYRAQLPA